MKINIMIMRICVYVVIICIIALICFERAYIQDTQRNTFQNITIGLLSSSIISFVISLTNYWNIRYIAINKIFNNLKDLYINIKVLTEIIGLNLEQSNFVEINKLYFSDIFSLSNLNISFISNMDLKNFHLFYQEGKLNCIINKIRDAFSILYSIKDFSSDLEEQALKYQLNILKQQINNLQNQDTQLIRNTIIIKLAKLHESVTNIAINLENILELFCLNTKNHISWDILKKSLEETILSITNKYRLKFY